jgi:hypothetical protein
MNSLSERVLKEIHTKKITPRSRWYFLTKEWILWLLWGAVTLCGAIAFSIMLFFFFNVNWKVQHILEVSEWKLIFQMVPLLWIVLFVALVALSFFNAHQTKRGYRYHGSIILLTVFLSFVLGFLVYRLGGAHIVESVLGSHIPRYQTLLERKTQMWHQPEEGFLGGQIVAIENPKIFVLRDKYLVVWNVRHNFQESSLIEIGKIVRIEGEVKENGYFEARTIFPVHIRGGKKEFLERHFQGASSQVKEIRGDMHIRECSFGQRSCQYK